MRNYEQLVERWSYSPWREAIEILADANCTKNEFESMIKRLYPDGGDISRSETHRGTAELFDCRGVDLSDRDLQNVDFYKIDLSGANFSGANIDGASFDTAQLMDTDFSRALASSNISFVGCFGVRSNFSNVQLVKGIFWGADLSDSNFFGATLDRCDFSNAILTGSNLVGAKMIDCDVQGMRLLEKERDAEWFRQSSFRNEEHIVWEKELESNT